MEKKKKEVADRKAAREAARAQKKASHPAAQASHQAQATPAIDIGGQPPRPPYA